MKNPQAMSAETRMPALGLSDADAKAVTLYLTTLKGESAEAPAVDAPKATDEKKPAEKKPAEKKPAEKKKYAEQAQDRYCHMWSASCYESRNPAIIPIKPATPTHTCC